MQTTEFCSSQLFFFSFFLVLLLRGFCLALANLGDKEGTPSQSCVCVPLQNIALWKVLPEREQMGREVACSPRSGCARARMRITAPQQPGGGGGGGQGHPPPCPDSTDLAVQGEVSFLYLPGMTSVLLQLGSPSERKWAMSILRWPLHAHTS